MADYLITIAVDGNGNFTYSPSTLHVQSGDQVVWQCNYNFAFMFEFGSPINQMTVNGQPAQDASGNQKAAKIGTVRLACKFASPAGLTVAPNINGHFHYAVAVWNTDTNSVMIDAGCSDLIVN